MAREAEEVKRLGTVLLIFAAGCSANVPELQRIETVLREEIARLSLAAAEIKQAQLELSALEKQFVAMRGELPPVTIRERRALKPVSLPRESPLEGAEAAKLRARIAALQEQRRELDSVIGDLDYLTERRAVLEAKIDEKLREVKR